MRVEPFEYITDSLKKIPFLERFVIRSESTKFMGFDVDKMNEYMNDVWIPRRWDSIMASNDINWILEEAERRGDI